MTLGMACWIAIAVLTACAAMRSYVRFAAAELDRLGHYQKWSNEFFKRAHTLLSEPDLPEETLDILSGVNFLITNEHAAQGVYEVYSRSLQDRSPMEKSAAFIKAHPELAECYAAALHSGLIAATYTDRFWGEKARSAFLERMNFKGKSPAANYSRDVQQIVSKVGDSHQHGNFAPA